jgi:hypothetical protein
MNHFASYIHPIHRSASDPFNFLGCKDATCLDLRDLNDPVEIPARDQFPARLEMVINLTAAKALGLTVPPPLLARADEVID